MNKLNLKKRYRRERWLAWCGRLSIIAAILFLAILLGSVFAKGWRTFLTASVYMEVVAVPALIGDDGQKSALAYQALLKKSLREQFPEIKKRREKSQLYNLLSFGAAIKLRDYVLENPDSRIGATISIWLPLASAAERYLKGGINKELLEKQRGLSDKQIAVLDAWQHSGNTDLSFNWRFFTAADSRDAELAGIGGALVGSFYSLLLAFLFSFPTGVLAAVYLELFAPRNRWLNFIEININNLAAVPSVIFGLLGLAIFINFFHLPRSSPLVGGLVLSLMTLPTVIISTRTALAAVPSSLLDGALSLGATKMRGVFHHVLPAAMPGILTGAIIGMAGALGETAPLLMIGMVAFITEIPSGITDAATALPVQIFLWADSPERGFVERTAAAITVLLVFLLVMNAVAVYLREKLKIKW